MSAGFVGRRVELALLDSVCSKANADNRPAAALISGLPGSGKSRLLAELRRRRRATHVLGVVGYESAFQVPLGAAGNVLRELGKVGAAGEMLSEFLFGPHRVDDRSLEPLRLFEAARRALLGLEGSILLIADDLQWVDDLSLALCSYLVRSAAEEEIPFAVIAATRPTTRGLAFNDSLIKDLGEDRVWTIDLGPLEPDEGAQLIRQLGPHLSAQRVAELWTRSKGSPFWLGFLARSGEEHDLGGYIATSQRGLGRDAARILALLSVATRPIEAPELEAVLEWDHARTERAIADLERSGLAVVQGVAVGLAHDLIRASAMAQLSESSRRELHALLATFLERHAASLMERKEEAFSLLELALSEATDDPVLSVEIASHRANLLQVQKHRAAEGRRAAFDATEKARELWGKPPVEIDARERDAFVAALQVAFDSALVEENGPAQLQIAEEMAHLAGSSEEGSILAEQDRATALMFAGRVGEAVASARRAWTQARQRMLPMLTLTAGSSLASKLIDIARFDEADEVISECVELERRVAGSGERFAMAKVGNWSIHDLRHQIWLSRGDWRDAIAGLEREVTLQSQPHFRMHLHWHISVWLARCGDPGRSGEVERHAEASRQDALAADCRRCSRELALKTAESFARLGRLEEAEKELQAWDENGRPGALNDMLWRRQLGALIAVARGDPAGIAEIEAVLAERDRLGLAGALLWTRLDLAGALVGSDRRRAAEEFRKAGDEAAAVGAATEQHLAELGLRRLGVRTWRRGQARAGESALDRLSEREREIATLIGAGHSNPEIASRLFLSRKTIERHVSNILARTGARNRTELARHLNVSETRPASS